MMQAATACLKLLDCLKAALVCACGENWRRPGGACYADVVHSAHTPIMMIGLIALLGAWRDPAHMAVAIAGVFGVVCVFLMQRLFDRDSLRRRATQCRRALIPRLRADEAIPLMPLRWRSAYSRSGGAPPPMFVFPRLVDQQDAIVRHSPPVAVASCALNSHFYIQ